MGDDSFKSGEYGSEEGEKETERGEVVVTVSSETDTCDDRDEGENFTSGTFKVVTEDESGKDESEEGCRSSYYLMKLENGLVRGGGGGGEKKKLTGTVTRRREAFETTILIVYRKLNRKRTKDSLLDSFGKL